MGTASGTRRTTTTVGATAGPLRPSNLWTFIIVTLVAVVIWSVADIQTREQRRLDLSVAFVAAAPSNEVWDVWPAEYQILLTIEGSRVALDRAEQLAARRIELPVPAESGRRTFDVLQALRENRAFDKTGATIVSSPEPQMDIEVDRIVSGVPVTVRPVLPSILVDGEVSVRPADVVIAVPERTIREPRIVVEARPPATDLNDLESGREYTVTADLVLPAELAGVRGVRLSPSRVDLTFRVRSRTTSTVLPTVRVQLAGPWQDNEEYRVRIADADTVLHDVMIEAESSLVQRINDNDVKVVAVLHLTNQDKARRITAKRIAGFFAILPDGSLQTISASVGGEQRPEIGVLVDKRVEPDATPVTPES